MGAMDGCVVPLDPLPQALVAIRATCCWHQPAYGNLFRAQMKDSDAGRLWGPCQRTATVFVCRSA